MRVVLPFLLLAACGGTSLDESFAADPLPEGTIAMGTTSTDAGSNGLRFAAYGDSADYTALEGQPVQVRMARMHRDPSTGDLSFLVTTETVTLSDGWYDCSRCTSSFTLDGVTYTLEGSAETDETGMGLRHDDWAYSGFEHGSEHRVTRVRTGYPDVIWDRGFFVMGLETSPEALTGSATYAGDFRSTTVISVEGGTPGHDYRSVNGDLTFVVNFEEALIGGSFTARPVTQRNDDNPFDDLSATGVIPQVALTGNGFESTLVFTDCPNHDSCGSDSLIGGAVYGPDGERISGVIMIDMTFTRTSDGADLHLRGPGVFSTDKQ